MSARSPIQRGQTGAAQGETTVEERVPRLPHERDESADSQQAAEPSGPAVARQAQDDVERGKVDTGRSP